MKRLTPNMSVQDVTKSVEYYVEHFGFTLVMAVNDDKSAIGDILVEGKEYVWANVMAGDVGLMFQRESSFKEDVGDTYEKLGASISLYIEVEDVQALYEKVHSKVEIHKELAHVWYGAKEFYVKDLNGYILAFSQRVS